MALVLLTCAVFASNRDFITDTREVIVSPSAVEILASTRAEQHFGFSP